jgi:hypothetical protein
MASVDDEIREQLQQVVAVIRPYAQSAGAFHDLHDVRSAIALARHLLERAEDLVRKNRQP